MALCTKQKPKDICQHLKRVMIAIRDNVEYMGHDFEGTYLSCKYCDCAIFLESYGDKITDEDIGDVTED